MSDITAEIPTDNAVPRGVVLFVKLLLDIGSNVFLNVELFHSLSSAVHGILLHVFGHIGILDHSFSVGHF
jgi:hypothetical protein